MDFDDYQRLAKGTATYPNIGNNFVYPALGLAGEAGEVANKIKKILRDDNGILTIESVDNLQKELGDCLWYLTILADELGLDLSILAEVNITKLLSRKQRGTLKGSGDER